MDFTFSPEQGALRAAVHDLVEREGGRELVRRCVDDDGRLPPALWDRMVELGWAGLLVPESVGGTGLGMVDLVVVQEELGRWAFPGPFLSSAVLATLAARHLGDDELLASLAAGSTRGTLALEELGGVGSLGGGVGPGGVGPVGSGPVGVGPLGGDVGPGSVGSLGGGVGPGGVGPGGVGPGGVGSLGGGVGPLGDAIRTEARTATTAEGGFVLAGLKPAVPDGDSADWALVVARDDAGLGTYLVQEPAGDAVPSLDVTRRVARLELSQRPAARRVGPAGDQTDLLQRVVDDAAVALCAETVGAGEAALALAVEYSKVRVQFDRPIGSFQAIRHKIVDMLHNLELARVATHFAAWASEADDPDRASAAAMAKGFVGEAANMITAESIQVHGGVGFTWDVDCHLYYRRVKQNDVSFGRSAWHRQRLAAMVIDTPTPT